MKKFLSHLFSSIVCLTIFTVVLSCQINTDEQLGPSPVLYTYVMRFEGKIQDFDGQGTRAAEAWTDGTTLTIQFKIGSSRVVGTATYKSKNNSWMVTAPELTVESEESCEVYYFEQPTATSGSNFTLGAKTIVYADKQAVYLIDEETKDIIVRAELSPLTSRLRFRGTSGRSYGVSGLKRYTAYNSSDNTFTEDKQKITGTFKSDGNSDFAYVLFADNNRQLTADALDAWGNQIGQACFIRNFDASVLVPASSGYLTLPTLDAMGSWTMSNINTGKEIKQPYVSTVTVGKTTYASAPVSASVTSLENGTLLEAGFVYSKSSNPDLTTGTKVQATAELNFSARITKLEEKQTYYVRAYARNERGTTLGAQQVFTTAEKPEDTSVERNEFGEEQGWD